jgi:hypothetical protein
VENLKKYLALARKRRKINAPKRDVLKNVSFCCPYGGVDKKG